MIQQERDVRIANKSAKAGDMPYYRPELDALRFFAFLCVFSFHRMDYVPTDPVRNAWMFKIGNIGPFGVPVFFLLSAFLITELLMRERERTGLIHIQAFYMRRILRIWPLYFVAFFGLALLNHFVPGVGTDDPRAWLAFTFFAGNWYILHHGWIAGSVDPLWSISVEEQFYIVIPLLAAFVGRKAVVVVSSALLAMAYVTVLLYTLHPVAGDNGEWTNSFVQFQFFSAGTLLALLLRGRLIRLAGWMRVTGFALGFGCWFTALLRFKVQSWEPHPTPGGALVGWGLVLAGAALFFVSVLGTPSRFVPRWLAYLGRISYGLYMVHSLVFFFTFEKALPYLRKVFPGVAMPVAIRDWIWTLMALGVSIGLASLSYHFFERPFLKLKKRFTFVAAREESVAQA
jgi:peptidoglycan/LPS O-acetylase OafA/YrhL